MVFEDEFMDKQSEIISLFKEAINDKTEVIYIFVFNDVHSSMITCAFNVDGKVLGNLDAGISDDTIDEIFDIIEEEIIPELEEICGKYDKPMPQEFRYIYNVITGAFDADYRYEIELSELDDYNPGITAMEWVHSFK